MKLILDNEKIKISPLWIFKGALYSSYMVWFIVTQILIVFLENKKSFEVSSLVISSIELVLYCVAIKFFFRKNS